jgi:hypothetical protein
MNDTDNIDVIEDIDQQLQYEKAELMKVING